MRTQAFTADSGNCRIRSAFRRECLLLRPAGPQRLIGARTGSCGTGHREFPAGARNPSHSCSPLRLPCPSIT